MYIQYEPPDELKHIVCFFYAMEHHSDDEPLQSLLPSGTAVNGWQYSGKYRIQYVLHNKEFNYLLPDFYVVGQQMIGYKLTAEQGLAGIFGASLQPGTVHRISGKPAWLYTNNVVESTTFFSPPVISPFITRFRKTKDNRERLALLTEFYRQFNIADEYELFKEAIRLIYRHRGCISVKKICENLRINERYLQREFRAKLGVAPSNYLKVIRFNNIFTELSLAKERQNLETLALLYNYYDLSHFNKEYKNYFGLAPSKFLLHEFSLLKDLISETPYLLEVQKRNSF